jgi:hypothetical protein
MSWKAIITTGAILFCSASFAQEDIVTNGAFDLEVPTNGSGGGWTAVNNDGAGGWRLKDENGFFILNSNGSSQSDPTIEQTLVELMIGSEYLIEGEYCNHYGLGYCDAAAFSFGVEVENSVILELQYSDGCPNFNPFAVSFIADATEQTIRFSAERNGSDCDYAIDNIQVTSLEMIFSDSFE